jgi:thioredoxin-dependent peroxiredoxin
MKVMRPLTAVFAAVMSLFNIGAAAALTPGNTAPEFKAPSVVDGKVVEFNLKDALAKHAVVLYFFPQAFTAG